jgi:DNA invertase Pin-like site-specific DNA recombinase
MDGSGRRRERVAIYTRQSTERRAGEPAITSCFVQYNRCLELVMLRGWEPIPEPFDDIGESGADTDRPGFLRLLQRIEDGAIDRVVVWRLDRLSRTMRDRTMFDEMLRSRGIGFTVGDGSIDRTGSSLATFQLNILASFAQLEREMIAERIRDGPAPRVASAREDACP